MILLDWNRILSLFRSIEADAVCCLFYEIAFYNFFILIFAVVFLISSEIKIAQTAFGWIHQSFVVFFEVEKIFIFNAIRLS